jgi:hypothetical protein
VRRRPLLTNDEWPRRAGYGRGEWLRGQWSLLHLYRMREVHCAINSNNCANLVETMITLPFKSDDRAL